MPQLAEPIRFSETIQASAAELIFFTFYAKRNPAYTKLEIGYMAGPAGLYAAADDVLYRVDLINLSGFAGDFATSPF